MHFIDFHFHNLKKYNNEVIGIYNPSVYNEALLNENIFFSAGINPIHITQNELQLADLEYFIKNKNCIAIGECGLDNRIQVPDEVQKSVFVNHIKLANHYQKPLIIHNVGRTFEILKILNDLKFDQNFVFHGFNLNLKIAEKITESGGYLSFGKALFNDQSNASKILNSINPNKILLETDDSAYIIDQIYEKTAFYLQISLINLKDQIYQNYHNYLNNSNIKML